MTAKHSAGVSSVCCRPNDPEVLPFCLNHCANGPVVSLANHDAAIAELQQQLSAERAVRERAEANERRYQFLRAGGPGTGLYVADSGAAWREVKGEQLDGRIDDQLGREGMSA